MPTLALPGLATGIDTATIVRQLVEVAKSPMYSLQNRQAAIREKSQAFTTLKTRLDGLQSALKNVRTTANLRAYAVSTNNDSALTAEAASDASEGAHEILVDQLAAADRKVHSGLAAAGTLVGAGTFAYTYNGVTRTIQTTATTTLEGLRDIINNDGGNPGVRASLLEYDAGGGQVFHLVLGGADTGADYAVAIDDVATTLDAFDSAAFTTTQAARNSRVRVDGYPAGAWIERSTNTLDDVLEGVTLHLLAASDAPVRLSLNRDTAGLKKKLADLVVAYNKAVEFLKEKTAYDQETRVAGVLMGEYSATYVLQQLRSPVIERAPGFLSGTDAYTLATQAGLSVSSTGLLELDEKVLDEALADDYLGVLSLLGADRTGASDSSSLQFYGARSSTTPGEYRVRAQFTGGVLTAAWIRRQSEGESAWRAATVDGNLIIGAAGRPEQNLQVAANYSGDGTIEAAVRVRQGVAGRLFDLVDDTLADALGLTAARLTSEIKRLQDQVDREAVRVARTQDRLTQQYARLEQVLTSLESQRGALVQAGLIAS